TRSEAETEALAAELAAAFRGGEVVLLSGELGSGKTVFVRGLARGVGDDPELGLEELPGPRGVLAIEWAERLSVHPWDPSLAVRVTLEHAGDDARRVRIEQEAA